MDTKKSKLYTKTGDNGFSSLYNGIRKPKNCKYFILLGDLDELNCNLGLVKALWKDEIEKSDIKLYNAPGAGAMFYKTEKGIDSGKYYEWFSLGEIITKLQCNIMDISSFIATPPFTEKQFGKIIDIDLHLSNWVDQVGFSESNIIHIEKLIDRLDSLLPPITNFVVPSGNKLSSQIHICRAISRRCERGYVDLEDITNNNNNNNNNDNNTNDIINSQIKIVSRYLNRLSDLLFVMSRFVCMTLNLEEDLYSRNKKIRSI